MSDEPTQACTLAIDHNDDIEDENENKKPGWAVLKSLNPAYPDFQLVEDESSFGRHPGSTFYFNDKNISGTHCIIKKEPTTKKSDPIIAFLHDQSTNGTYINANKIGKNNRHLLVKDQEISLVLGKNKNANERISFIYRPVEKEDDEDGGPQKKYLVGETLGSGNFATVKLAVDRKSGEKYAIKIIDKKKYFMNSSNRKDALMDEVNILKGLNHINIIHIQEVFDTEKTLYLVLELIQGGELLNDILNCAFYPEAKAKLLFKQIVNGVQYLHDRGIAHRDLKPENILLKQKGEDLDPNDDSSIKLSDFGLSRTINAGSMMTTMCGTPQYLAPEIIMGTNNSGYGIEVDCWSMGAILYVMLCGYPPFDESKDISIFEQIRHAVFEFPDDDWSTVSEEAKDLIKRLLNLNPVKRYNCQQISNHPWLNPNASLKSLLESEQSSSQQKPSSQPQSSQEQPKLNEKSNSILGKRKSEDLSDDTIFNNNNNNNNGSNKSSGSSNNTIDNQYEEQVQKKIKLTKEQNDDDTDDEVTNVISTSNASSFKSDSSKMNIDSNKNTSSDSLFNNNNNNNNNSSNNNNNSLFNSDSLFNNSSSKSLFTNNNNNYNSYHYNNNNDDSENDTSKKDEDDDSNNNNSSDNTNNQSPPTANKVNTPTIPKPSHYPTPSTNIVNNPIIPAKPTTPTKPPQQTPVNGAVDNRPMCKYGHQCYRKNPSHFKEYKHPLPQ